MNDEELEARFIELETKLAFQDDTVIKLNEALSLQQQQLFKLENTIKLLQEEQKKLADPDELKTLLGHERPPHY